MEKLWWKINLVEYLESSPLIKDLKLPMKHFQNILIRSEKDTILDILKE